MSTWECTASTLENEWSHLWIQELIGRCNRGFLLHARGRFQMPFLGLPASASYQLGATTGSSKLQFQGSYCPCKRRCKQHEKQNCLVNYTEVHTSSQPAHDSSSALSKYQSHTLGQQLDSFPCLCLMPDFFLLPSLLLFLSVSPSFFSFLFLFNYTHKTWTHPSVKIGVAIITIWHGCMLTEICNMGLLKNFREEHNPTGERLGTPEHYQDLYTLQTTPGHRT